jgi:hypothetical protein
MIYTLMLVGLIGSLFFFVYNKYFVDMQIEVNIVRTLGFLFISLFLAYIVNKIWNKRDKYVPLPTAPPKNTDTDDDKYSEIIPNALREELMMINKLGNFSINTN